ncbi:MAG TPA: tetratricopeptide repeat protein [Sandaracinaceae bacterium LLY-WYZ-13_1]|nr:tetratricopeptide repeat protein [Sandaracinaceae bacterium LLY-WYZ-13_1]
MALPLPPRMLFGLEGRLRPVLEAFRRGERLITLTGPAGIGKTTLALAVLERSPALGEADGAVDGVFVDLVEARTVADLVASVIDALGLEPALASGDEAAAVHAVGDALDRRGPTTLVLDNFEQLVPHGVDAVRTWATRARRTRWLVTTRHRLRAPIEHVVEVPALRRAGAGEDPATDEGVQLLMERAFGDDGAGAARPEALAGIVARLEHNPLAIELAASRLVLLGPRELEARLADPFALLTDESGLRPARHGSLERAVACTWHLLGERERRVLRRCSVFRGGFTVDAAERVVGDDLEGDLLGCLVGLRDKSWLRVRPGTEARPRLDLYVAVRALVARDLAGEERAACRTRHTRTFVERAEARVLELERAPDPEVLEDVRTERPNLRGAVEWAVARAAEGDEEMAALAVRGLLAWSTSLRITGPLDAAVAVLDERTPSLWDRLSASARARLLCARIHAERRVGRWDDAVADGERAYELALESDDEVILGAAALQLGLSAARTRPPETSERLLRESLAIHRRTGNLIAEGFSHTGLALVARERGEHGEAIEHVERAIEAMRRADATRPIALLLNNLGSLHLGVGHHEEAERCFQEAARLEESIGDQVSLAMALMNSGLLAYLRGAEEDALRTMAEAAARAERVGAEVAFRNAVGYAAVMHMARGEDETARSGFARSLEGARGAAQPKCARLFESCALLLDGLADGPDRAARALEGFLASAPTDDPLTSALLRTQRAWIDIARARRAREAKAPNEALAAREAALERLRAMSTAVGSHAGWTERSADAALLVRALRTHLERTLPPLDTESSDAILRVHPEGEWFRPPHGVPVDCRRRRVVKRILSALARARVREPGAVLSPEALIGAGWPDERFVESSAKNRLHVTLATLRKLGLSSVLESHEAGYRLDPEVPTELREEALT